MTNRALTRALNTGKVGNIEASLKSYALMDASNDGAGFYSVKECIPVTSLPVGSEDDIEINLTSTDFHIVQLHDSFISMNVQATLMFTHKLIEYDAQTLQPGARDVFESQYLFVGLKSGSQFIREYNVIHRNVTISNSMQNAGTQEAYLMNLYKPRAEKNNRKHIHSLYESVHHYDTSCCGVYVPIMGKEANIPFIVNIPISIPIDDLCSLQGMREYPNELFGELKLRFRINPAALVYCRVDPIASATKELIQRYHTFDDAGKQAGRAQLKALNSVVHENGIGCQYSRHYTQIGDRSLQLQLTNPTEAGGTIDAAVLQSNIVPNFTINVQSVSVQRCTISLAGYRASKQCLDNLRDYFQTHPFVVPGQRIEVKVLGSPPTASGFQQCQTNIPLNHVTDFILLFPKNSKQVTCFENPMYQDLQLTVGSNNYPSRPVTTCNDPQFFQLMLNASDLDSLFECTDEYEDSLTLARANNKYILNPHTDVTSFAVTLQAERSGGSGIYFDGVTSNGENVSIELRGSPMYRDNLDNYAFPRLLPTDPMTPNLQAPLLCTLQDTFWLFTAVNGGTCEYVRDYTAEEALRRQGYIQEPVRTE